MQRLEVSGAVRPLQWSLGVKGLKFLNCTSTVPTCVITPVVNRCPYETPKRQPYG